MRAAHLSVSNLVCDTLRCLVSTRAFSQGLTFTFVFDLTIVQSCLSNLSSFQGSRIAPQLNHHENKTPSSRPAACRLHARRTASRHHHHRDSRITRRSRDKQGHGNGKHDADQSHNEGYSGGDRTLPHRIQPLPCGPQRCNRRRGFHTVPPIWRLICESPGVGCAVYFFLNYRKNFFKRLFHCSMRQR